MRDILLSIVLVVLLVRATVNPRIGAYLWTWLSLMNPHRLTYGFAASLPWAMATAVVTLLSLPFSKQRKPLPMNGGVIALILLWAWMLLTSSMSINNMDEVWERFAFVSKIHLMLLVTMMLLRGRQQIETLVWIVMLSIGYFCVKGGLYTLATAGAGRVWGPPGTMLMDNNALAVASVMTLPFMYYLRQAATKPWLKNVLLGSMVLTGASILGSQSRGALLSLLAMSFLLGIKSKYPVRSSLALVLLLAIGIAFMPDSWTTRMDTVRTYTDEGSAMSRIYTWHTLWNLVLDRPILGAGFRADNIEVFVKYAPTDSQYEMFFGRVWVAHSIYFQALGEHGFIGLILYLAIWVWVWFAAGRVSRQASAIEGLKEWVPLLMRMCQVALVGFLVGGAFLSLMNLDLPFYILVFVTLAQCAVREAPQPAPVSMAPVIQAAAGKAEAMSMAARPLTGKRE